VSAPVRYSERALRQLRAIDRRTGELITRRIDWIAEHIDEANHHALRGSPPGRYRLRVGDYRVIYLLREGRLEVVAVGHRRDVYR
jgi:mRNA interferase RelE/StbE